MRKMWTTASQVEFLEAQLPEYHIARLDHTIPDFFTEVYFKFFSCWANAEDEGENGDLSGDSSIPNHADWVSLRMRVRISLSTFHVMLNLQLLQQIRMWFYNHRIA